MKNTFTINTLHRGKYMLLIISLIFVAGGLSSLLPTKEIYKVIVVLFACPIVLFTAVKGSRASSEWSFDNQKLDIVFPNKKITVDYDNIDNIRSLTRSGGNLIEIYQKKGKTLRLWRNKLFQADDDLLIMQQYLTTSEIEFYKL